MNDVLSVFLTELLGVSVPQAGAQELSEERTAEAFELIQDTANMAAGIRHEVSLIPRLSVREHKDMVSLLALVRDRIEETRTAMLTGAAMYSMQNRVKREELFELQDEYLTLARIEHALSTIHQTWHAGAFPDVATSALNDEALRKLRNNSEYGKHQH